MVTTWPKNFPVLGTGAEELARQIAELWRPRKCWNMDLIEAGESEKKKIFSDAG